jgi:hypothetical protein
MFAAGSSSAQTSWTGWLTFASPPVADHVVVITFGRYEGSPAVFQASGAVANVTGSGSDYIIRFAASPGVFVVPKGGRLAVRLENTGDSALQLLVGGAAWMFFAPAGSRPGGPMPPLFLLD